MKRWLVAAAFARLPLLQQFTLLMAGLLILGCAAALTINAMCVREQALDRARTLALLADAAGMWSSQYRGVWVFSDPSDPGISVGESLDHRQARVSDEPQREAGLGSVDIARTAGTFHRKVPSAVQRELFELVGQLSTGERLRLAHQAPLDPRNAPNRFEQAAIERLRRGDPARDEYFESHDGQLSYARPLTLRGECLRCHSGSAAAPAAMKARYGMSTAWGEAREGAFGGVVSVVVPLRSGGAGSSAGAWGAAWVMLAGWAAAFASLLPWLRRRVVGAAAGMEAYAQCLLSPKAHLLSARIVVNGDEIASRNELHRLSLAIKALHRALREASAQAP